MKKISLYISVLFTTVIICCTISCTGKNNNEHKSHVADSIYNEAYAMRFHVVNPQRALHIIDSATMVGNIDYLRAQYLKAVTYQIGLHDYATSEGLCKKIIENDHAARDTVTLFDTYKLLTQLSLNLCNYSNVLSYSKEALALARAQGNNEDIQEINTCKAIALVKTGHMQEGMTLVRHSLDELENDLSLKATVAYMNSAKKYCNILFDADKIDEIPAVCNRALERLDKFIATLNDRDDISPTFDPDVFADIFRCKYNTIAAIAYAEMDDRTNALKHKALAEATNWSTTSDGAVNLAILYYDLQDWDKMDRACSKLQNLWPDSINDNNLHLLKLKAKAAMIRGNSTLAISLLDQAAVIRDSLDARKQREHVLQLATIYSLNDKELLRQQAEARTHYILIIAIVLLIGIIIAISFLVFFYYNNVKMRKKNIALVKMIDNQRLGARPLMMPVGLATDDTKAHQQFEEIKSAIISQRLYAKSDLQRQDICNIFGISRERLNRLIADYSDANSFPTFINDLRISEACTLLKTQPGMTVTAIAETVGLSLRNFRKIFVTRYGITPSDYRQAALTIEDKPLAGIDEN